MFLQDAKSLLESGGWSEIKSPFRLLDIWEGVVCDMETGYNFNIYEYDNDVSVRGAIQSILDHDVLKQYPEYKEFERQAATIDERFRNLLSEQYTRNDRSVWWEAGILRNAGEEYAKDIEDLYGYRL